MTLIIENRNQSNLNDFDTSQRVSAIDNKNNFRGYGWSNSDVNNLGKSCIVDININNSKTIEPIKPKSAIKPAFLKYNIISACYPYIFMYDNFSLVLLVVFLFVFQNV